MTVPKLTKEQAAIIGLYTGYTCGPFADVHELAEEVLNRPILTHEFGSAQLHEKLQEKIKDRFMEICHAETPR